MALKLPSFNDFSPGLLGNDLRPVLQAIAKFPGDEAAIFEEWERGLFKGWDKKRVRTNLPATLGSTGLTSGRPMRLSTLGTRVAVAASPQEAAAILCRDIISARNGMKLVEAIANLSARETTTTKKTLQTELERLGVKLSNDTTDHTTLKNWMIVAGIVGEPQKGRPSINDTVLKKLTGVSTGEHDELQSLSLGPKVFLTLLRRKHALEKGPFNASHLYTECKATYPDAFGSANFAKAVRDRLTQDGWAVFSEPKGAGRGGKIGTVSGTAKLLAVPLERVIPDFARVVPADLHSKLNTPLSKIKEWLDGADKHKGGLALELLALRIILDLRLVPRDFRLRSKQSAFAEVDVTAEGAQLLFSRWTFQCKRVGPAVKVSLADVAKEVGIAVYMKAQVIVLVSTGGFSSDARNFAREITRDTHMQFLFLDRKIVDTYLRKGSATLHEFVMNNASEVMKAKRVQPIAPPPAS